MAGPATAFAEAKIHVKNLQPISGANPFPNASHQRGAPNCSRKSSASPEVRERLDLELEAALAVNPQDQKNIVSTWIQGDSYIFEAAYTKNGGRTWRRSSIPFHPCTGGPYYGAVDPGASFRPDGVATLALQSGGSTDQDPVPFGQAVVRSSTGGRTWTQPVEVQPLRGYNDKQRAPVAWDPTDSKTGYLGWFRAHDDFETTGLPSGSDLYFASTADGGRTWSQPWPMYETLGPGRVQLNNLMHVLSDGTLVNTFVDFNQQNQLAGIPPSPNDLLAIRSRDRGMTWSEPARVATVAPTFVSHPDSGEAILRALSTNPYSALGPDGTLYMVWTDVYSTESSRIIWASSEDGGRTWDEPRSLANLDSQAFAAAIAVMPDGTLGVTWYDLSRDVPADGAVTMDFWFAHSRDEGRTWKRRHIGPAGDLTKSRHTAPDPGTDRGRYNPTDYGDLVALPRGFATVFTQAEPVAEIGSTDIAFARILVRPKRRR